MTETYFARVLKRSVKRTPKGGVLQLSRRDARILSKLGFVEILTDPAQVPQRDLGAKPKPTPARTAAAEVDFRPSPKLDEAVEKPKRARRTRKPPRS